MRHLLHQIYPTGRKHCSDCGRWRPLTDFSVRKWWDTDREIPHLLQARCRACGNVKARDGRPPRKIGHDPKESQRKCRENLKKDPMRLALRREYARIWEQKKRRAEGAERKPCGPKVKLDVGIDGYWVVEYQRKRVAVKQADATRNVLRLVVKREKFVPVPDDEEQQDCA
jgi:hypothetical protein